MQIQIPIIMFVSFLIFLIFFLIMLHELTKIYNLYQVMNVQKCVLVIKHQNIVNNTAIKVLEISHTHSMKGFAGYIQLITIQLYQENSHLENYSILTFTLHHDVN